MSTLPSGWARAAIRDVLKIKYGKALPKDQRDPAGPVPVVGSAGRMTGTHTSLVSSPAVLIGRKGNAGAVQLELNGSWPIDTTYYAEIPATLEPRFLSHQLTALDLRRLDSSTTTPSLRREDLEAQTLVIPPIDEQRRIVDLLEDHLSRLDAAQGGLAKTRKRLVSLERSALDAHFGAAESTAPLGDLIENISAGKSFGASSARAQDDQWGIIKVCAMTWGAFKPEENKAVPPDRVDPRFEIHEGDLLVSRANTSAYVGASVLVGPVRPKLLLSDKSLRVVPKDGVRPEWLWHALQAPSARRQISALATGTKDSMRNISQASLLRVLLPAVDETEQARAIGEFAAIDEASRRLAREVEATDARLRHLRRALMADAFSGCLTVRALDLSVAEEMITE